MPSTLFVALQCCQCSTMQVKQQKKSSNKWLCVVCNRKQSVRKVFAQGYKAKDLRFFVQSFNMNRNSLEDTVDDDDAPPAQGRKRRTDWNEYLDLPDDRNQIYLGEEEEKNGDGFEPKIVTEVPKEMFKRPRLNNYSNSGNVSDGNQLYKPAFSKRSINKLDLCLDRVSHKKPINLESGGVSKGTSRWNAYMTEETVNQQLGWRSSLKDDDDTQE